MAEVRIDADVERRLAGSREVDAELMRRGRAVQAAAKRVVHVDTGALRESIYVRQVGDEVRVGSELEYALIEELHVGGARGGSHSYLRAALPAAGDR